MRTTPHFAAAITPLEGMESASVAVVADVFSPLPQLPPFEHDLHTVEYTYDAISRLLNADYHAGINTAATPFRENAYEFDLAGNLVDMDGVTRTYNAANQLVDDGTNTLTYDDNGNLTSDGTNAYTWDRANRLLSMGGSSYAYDGLSNRISQTVGANVTQYLLDVQPGLVKVLAATTGANTERYVHTLRGIHSQEDNAGVWTWAIQDALGNVRGEADNNLGIQAVRNFAPYLTEFGTQGTFAMPFAATGELRDPNLLLFLRNRYLNPALGVFASLDPAETRNRYAYASANPVNRVDPSGLFDWVTGITEPGDCLYCIGRDLGIQPEANPAAIRQFIDQVKVVNSWQANDVFITRASDCPPNVQDCPSATNPPG